MMCESALEAENTVMTYKATFGSQTYSLPFHPLAKIAATSRHICMAMLLLKCCELIVSFHPQPLILIPDKPDFLQLKKSKLSFWFRLWTYSWL